MGSLATVKVLREKSPTEITKNLLKDISSQSQSVRMGNLLRLPSNTTTANYPPSNLDKLLEDIVKENATKTVSVPLTSETVDTIIEDSRWGKEFRKDLKADLYIAILR